MSTVKATFSGFIGHEGVPAWVNEGDEYDENHPLVAANPQKFTEPKRSPGRPLGSKNKPATDG